MSTIKLQQQGDALNMTILAETIERLGVHAGQELGPSEQAPALRSSPERRGLVANLRWATRF